MTETPENELQRLINSTFSSLPTDEDMRKYHQEKWDILSPTLLSTVDPSLYDITTVMYKIPMKDVIEYLLPIYDGKDLEDSSATILNAGFELACNSFPSGFMWKLDSRSPKDFGIEKLTSGDCALFMHQMFSSMRVFDDLVMQRLFRDEIIICFREWVDIKREYRIFVAEGEIEGITINSHERGCPEEYTEEYITEVTDACKEIVNRCSCTALPRDYVVDVALLENGNYVLVEINPYGLSDPCLFKSYDNISGFAY